MYSTLLLTLFSTRIPLNNHVPSTSIGKRVTSLNYNGSALFAWINSGSSVHVCVGEKVLLCSSALH